MASNKYIKPEDLIPGRWYTCKHRDANNYTFKFTHLENLETFYRIFSSRYIQGEDVYDKHDYFANNDFLKTMIFADMDYVIKFYPHEVPQINNSYSII